MNTLSILFLLLLTLSCLSGESLPPGSMLPAQESAGLQKSDWQSIRAAHEAWQHEFRLVDGNWQANNRGQRWTAVFDGRGFLAVPKDAAWRWGLRLENYGFGSNLRPVTGTPKIKAAGQRLSYHWQGGLEEWFVNDGRGLEHGFIVAGRPEGAQGGGPLVFTLSADGGLRPSVADGAQTVHFRDAGGAPILNYSGLKAWDADGTILKAWFEQRRDGQFCIAVEEASARYPVTIDPIAQQAYLKASSNGQAGDDMFGSSVAVSGDTVVVGAENEDSGSTGVNSTPDESATDSGAAYVFTRSGSTWSQQAYLKASNTGAGDRFGRSVAVSGDTVIVGADNEDSSTTGVNSTPNESGFLSGAAYVFVRSGSEWSQQAYLKASNAGDWDYFGRSVAASGDTVVVGAYQENGSKPGVNSIPDDLASASGAAYVFVRSGSEWSQQAYIKASNPEMFDYFGRSVAVSGDTIIIGADGEDSSTTGVNSFPNDSSGRSGAAYIFVRGGSTWRQQAYLKASNSGAGDRFGWSVSVSGDTAVVGAYEESSSTTGVNSVPNDSSGRSGAAYIFVRSGVTWSQQAYLKASNSGAGDEFGWSVSVSGDTAIIGAYGEASGTAGVNSTPDESSRGSGAAYIFVRSGGSWAQQAYVKISSPRKGDLFGWSVAVSGDTAIIGAYGEASGTTGVNSTPDESSPGSGAAYVFVSSGGVWTQQAYCKSSNTTGNSGAFDQFGESVAVSGDTVVVGAAKEDSGTTGVNSLPDETEKNSGAAYVFVRNGGEWTQQAYLKASNTGENDGFGISVAVSGDTLVVGAYQEASKSTGVNSVPNDDALYAGAAYVFVRNGGAWSQQAYLKASNTGAMDLFGVSVAVSGDTVIVGAESEDSSTTGVNSVPNEFGGGSGAAYVFVRNGSEWTQQAYLKASNTGARNSFGCSVAVSGDTAVVGADEEDSSSTGVDSTPNDDAAYAGAAYVFVRGGGTWSQQAYLKASNTETYDNFGTSVAVSGDTVVVGADGEDSGTTGVNSVPTEFAGRSGAAYVFVRSGGTWSQQAYLKASNAGTDDFFGGSVAVSGDTVIIGASEEDSSTTGVNSLPDEAASGAGAAYVFVRSGNEWSQQAYLKDSTPGGSISFGVSVAVSGDILVVGAENESSNTTGVNSTPGGFAVGSGAAYIFSGFGPAEIVVEAPAGVPVANGGSVFEFGHTAPGQSADRAFTLRNTGAASLGGIAVSITGPDANQFSVISPPPAALAGGDSAAVTVQFTPVSPGAKTATLSIASSDADENPFTLVLNGTGNNLPRFNGYTAATAYETAAVIPTGSVLLSASDPDGDSLTITAAGPASAQGGTVLLQPDSLSYTPAGGFSGADTFAVTIRDARGATVSGTITVNVAEGPNSPLLTLQPGGVVQMTYRGIPGSSYKVQRSTDLMHWTVVATVTAGPAGVATFADPSPPPGTAFYRICQP